MEPVTADRRVDPWHWPRGLGEHRRSAERTINWRRLGHARLRSWQAIFAVPLTFSSGIPRRAFRHPAPRASLVRRPPSCSVLSSCSRWSPVLLGGALGTIRSPFVAAPVVKTTPCTASSSPVSVARTSSGVARPRLGADFPSDRHHSIRSPRPVACCSSSCFLLVELLRSRSVPADRSRLRSSALGPAALGPSAIVIRPSTSSPQFAIISEQVKRLCPARELPRAPAARRLALVSRPAGGSSAKPRRSGSIRWRSRVAAAAADRASGGFWSSSPAPVARGGPGGRPLPRFPILLPQPPLSGASTSSNLPAMARSLSGPRCRSCP